MSLTTETLHELHELACGYRGVMLAAPATLCAVLAELIAARPVVEAARAAVMGPLGEAARAMALLAEEIATMDEERERVA